MVIILNIRPLNNDLTFNLKRLKFSWKNQIAKINSANFESFTVFNCEDKFCKFFFYEQFLPLREVPNKVPNKYPLGNIHNTAVTVICCEDKYLQAQKNDILDEIFWIFLRWFIFCKFEILSDCICKVSDCIYWKVWFYLQSVCKILFWKDVFVKSYLLLLANICKIPENESFLRGM